MTGPDTRTDPQRTNSPDGAAALEAVTRAEDAFFRSYGLRADRSEVVSGDGRRVRVLQWGSGPPLVMLHGIGILASHWAPLAARLPGRRCIALDLPGIGMSDPVPYGHADLRTRMVEFLIGVLTSLGLRRVPVAASSFGGMCALWLAADRPSCVETVAFLGAPGVGLPASGSLPAALAARIPAPAWAARALRPPHAALTGLALRVVLGPNAWKNVGREAVAVTHAALQIPRVREEMWRLLRVLARPGGPGAGRVVVTEEELRRVEVPCLFVWGSRDVYMRPGKAERVIASIPQARIVVVEGGHAPWFDDAATCAQLLGDFTATRGVP